MIKSFIIYFICLISLIAFYFLYPFYLSFFLLALFLFFTLISFLYVFIAYRFLNFHINLESKKATIHYTLFPWVRISSLTVQYSFLHRSTQTLETHRTVLKYAQINETKLEIVFPEDWIGTTILTIDSIAIQNACGLFALTKKVQQKLEHVQMPKKTDISSAFSQQLKQIASLSTQTFYHSTLPTDFYDIKPYTPYDSFRQIHWKISSKKDALYVKDYLGLKSSSFLLIVKLMPTIEESNYVFEACYNFACALLKENLPFQLYIFANTGTNSFTITQEIELEQAFYEIFQLLPCENSIYDKELNKCKKEGFVYAFDTFSSTSKGVHES